MFSLDENQKPIDDGAVVPEPVVMPAEENSAPTPTPTPVATPAVDPVVEPQAVVEDVKSDPSAEASGELADLQKQAISELAPILGKLELSNEDKFNTTMMMVQATDNKALLRDAHEAAKAIEDEKVRAQALLDIINEINYFTTKKD